MKTCTFILLASALCAQADSVWTAANGADWNTSGNWDNGVPGAGDAAIFLNDASLAASLTASASAEVGQIAATNGGAVALSFAPFALTVNEALGIDGGARFALESGAIDGAPATAIGTFANGNSLTVAPGARAQLGALRVGYNGIAAGADSSFNTLSVRPGAALVAQSIVVGGGNDGNNTFSNRIEFSSCVVTNLGAFSMLSRTQNTAFFIRDARFYNGGEFRFGAWGSNNSNLSIEDSIFTVANTFILSGDNSGTSLIISNSTINCVNFNVDTGSNKIELYQDEGKTTLLKVSGSIQHKGRAAPIVVHGGRLEVGGNIQAANSGANSALILLGTNSSAACGSYWCGSYSGSGFGLVITNGALTVSGAFNAGSNNGGQPATHAIISGPHASVTAGSMFLGYNGNVHNSSIALDGGAINIAGAITIGGNGGNISTNNLFAISGATSRVAASTLTLKNATRLAYTVPVSGFEQTPILLGAATGTAATISDDTAFLIDAAEFQKAGGHGWVTLLETAGGAISGKVPLANFTLKLYRGADAAPQVEQSASRIRVKIPSSTTTLILIQ